MKKQIKRLPDAELEVMLIVWNSETPVNSAYILERLQGKRKWGLPTLMTVLSRLTEKGFLVCEKQGWNNLYHAAIDEDLYKQSESSSILEKLYGNSFTNLVTSLYKGNSITKEDLVELRRFIDDIHEEE